MRVYCPADSLRLTIVLENLVDPDYRPARPRGIGLANVRERLEMRYGKDAAVAASTEGEIFRVSLTLPVERSIES